jgi:hypothetical protein
VLWAFAIAQPLLDLLGRTPEFFVARGNGSGDILLLGFGLILLPPAALLGVEALVARLRPALAWPLHLALIALLAAALALQVLTDLASGPAGLLLVAAAGLGATGAFAYSRAAPVRTVLTVLTPAPAVFLVIFLLISPVSKLVLPQDEAAAVETSGGTGAPVVVILFDELPASSLMDADQSIDARRYPSFAELSQQATWFRHATTVADGTETAVPALLSGDIPTADQLPTAFDYPDNLFTLLGGSYRLNVTEDATELCPTDLCGERAVPSTGDRLRDLVSDLTIVSGHLLLPDSLRADLPAVDQTFEDFGTPDQVEQEAPPPREKPPRTRRARAIANAAEAAAIPIGVGYGVENRATALEPFLARMDAQPRTLHFFDILIPHYPWEYLPSGQRYPLGEEEFSDGIVDGDSLVDDPRLVREGIQRHLLQVGYADWILGRVIARMKWLGIWDQALVVVSADHGTGFVPGELRRRATRRNYAEIASVPILVKSPGQRQGRVDERPMRTIDVLPTIAAELGIDLPFETDGTAADELPEDEVVSVSHRGATQVEVPFDRFVGDLGALVERNEALFGGDPGWSGVYGFDPGSDLIGRPVEQVTGGSAIPTAPASLELVDEGAYDAVRPHSTSVPALVKGMLEGTVPAGTEFAVAVNGRVAAVGRTHEQDGATRLLAVVPPQAFRRGENQVEAFTVSRAGSDVTLASVGGANVN